MQRDIFEDEHLHFREAAQTFIAREVLPNHERWREQGFIDRDLWLAAGRVDFLGLSVPGEHGGSGTDDYRFNVVLTEELARVGLALASSIGIHTDVCAPYLVELTSEEQRARWLPRFCTGEQVTAIGMTEPGAGSDLAGLRTQAKRTGDGWMLNGAKTFITNGSSADLVIVAARTGAARGAISLFGVEASTSGFRRGTKLHKVGQHEADTSELFFDELQLTDGDLIGELDRGFAAMMQRLPTERLHVACANLAHARGALDVTPEYVADRRAFGRPIRTFQHNRFLLAELVTAIDVAQAYVDRCIMSAVEKRLDTVDPAKAKWWTADVQNRVIDACVQLHGGYGYMYEYPVTRASADARITRIWGGSNEIMKEVIGRSLGLAEGQQ